MVAAASGGWGPAVFVAGVVGCASLGLAFNQQRLVLMQLVLARVDRFFDSERICEQRRRAAQSWLDGDVDSGAVRDVLNALEELAILRDRRMGSYGVIRDAMGWWIVGYWHAYGATVRDIRTRSNDSEAWAGVDKLASRLTAKGFRATDAGTRSLLEDDAAL